MAMWLVAGTDTAARYPCLCRRGDCDPAWCPCAGRTDVEAMPPGCCSRRYGPAEAAAAQRAYNARRRPRQREG